MALRGPQTCCGTSEDSLIWCNSSDCSGIAFSVFVLIGILFCSVVIAVVYAEGDMATSSCIAIYVFIFLSVWSHLRTMLGDPGAVPPNAHPTLENMDTSQTVCGRCECYKPPMSHHDRVSKRCISRMDHFCPWMNNAIGAKNQKNFFLFLIYLDLTAIVTYIVIVTHLLDCGSSDDDGNCSQYSGVALDLARILIFLLIFAILFTSSMIINQCYGLAVGLGTIDRMKLKDDDEMDGTPVPFHHVFGDWWPAYFLPLDPVYNDPESVFHYRLLNMDYCRKG